MGAAPSSLAFGSCTECVRVSNDSEVGSCTECVCVSNDCKAVTESWPSSRHPDSRLGVAPAGGGDERPPKRLPQAAAAPAREEVPEVERRGPAKAAGETEEEAGIRKLLECLPAGPFCAFVGRQPTEWDETLAGDGRTLPTTTLNLAQDPWLAGAPAAAARASPEDVDHADGTKKPDVDECTIVVDSAAEPTRVEVYAIDVDPAGQQELAAEPTVEVFRIFTAQASEDGCSRGATLDTDAVDTSIQELSDSSDDAQDVHQGLREEPAADPAPSVHVEPREEAAELEPREAAAELEPREAAAEAWLDFLTRSRERVQAAGVADEAAALLKCFQTTHDVGLTFATFARLFLLATPPAAGSEQAPPWDLPAEASERPWRFPYQAIGQLLGGTSWKAKKLWKLLDDRASRPEYAEAACGKGRLRGRRCVVIGAGPCGLRAAIELRLLGAQVVLIEQRHDFSRINQLHIWSWCGEDLKGLGARLIEPPPKDFGANPDLLVISISDLQKLLLKVALLLGVDVRMGVEYDSISRVPGSWQATIRPAGNVHSAEGRAGPAGLPGLGQTPTLARISGPASTGLPPSHFCPGLIRDVSVLIGSGGFASCLGDEVGMRTLETESLRKDSAIGLVCNIVRTHGKGESELRSFSMARQFYMRLFQQLKEKTGADLENIVYVKAAAAHYFVMTPTPKCLVETGVVMDAAHRPLLAPENIDRERLAELMRSVACYQLKEGEPAVLEAIERDAGRFPGWADSGPRLFDFSKMRRSQDGVLFLPPRAAGDESARPEDESLMVALVGDALIEPFWPEGLGIMRGFFGALDACHAVRQWSDGATNLETQEQYQKCYQQLKTLSAATRANVLRPDERSYALEPSSRYR